jgi:DNA-directed RNA polymerase subunit RPC12/RpoP
VRVVFVGRRRIVWRRLVLYLATLGISRRIWLHRVLKEVDGHEALELNHKAFAALLWLPIIGPTIVQARFAKEAAVMTNESPFALRPGLYWASWIPILGNLAFIGIAQAKLNGFWEEQLGRPEGGVEIDFDLANDPQFIVEFEKALPESYNAGSRFDRKKRLRRAKWKNRLSKYEGVSEDRLRMRVAGGTTSIFPWVRPKSLRMSKLGLTCGQCAQKFEVARDPYAETAILCPNCGLHEVLPSLRGNPLARPERAAIVTVEADCPKCERHFHALRNIAGETKLECPDCKHAEILAES